MCVVTIQAYLNTNVMQMWVQLEQGLGMSQLILSAYIQELQLGRSALSDI